MEVSDNFYYLYLQSRLLESANRDNEISYKEATVTISKSRTPKALFSVLIKEMQDLQLLKVVNRFKIKIINPEKCEKIKKHELNGVYFVVENKPKDI